MFALSDTTATLINPPNSAAGRDITIQNIGTGYVYLGSTDQTSSTDFGFRLNPNAAWSVEFNGEDEIYAIAQNNGDQIALFSLRLEN
jgi:hypothetical protein